MKPDNRFRPDDVEVTGIFLRVMAKVDPEFATHALLSADLKALAEALAEVRAWEWQRGYNQGRTDALEAPVAAYNLNPDAPTRDELGELRGEERDSDSPSGWTTVPRVDDYPGGRWPGRETS